MEDEIIEAMFLGKILELWGYEVCEITTSGEDAVHEAEVERPDAVIMDIYIHGKISGIEAADKIRFKVGIPIIFMTGYSDEETKQKACAAHAAGYFVKPLNYNRLKEALTSIVPQDS
ncbi:MAG TPA: response regulator [Thermodesulfovibrionales bacterium]|nr:response regulator [Thermodesulfovibrionales bacterium]